MEYAGFETTLEKQISGVWTLIAQVRDIGGPTVTSEQIEASHRDSQFRRYVAGMKDGGEVSFDVIFDPDHASHDPTLANSIADDNATGVVSNWRMNFPGAGGAVTRAAFQAFVSSFQPNSPLEDALTAAITLKLSGAITWTHVP
jgi:hypothetical protein